MYPIFFSTPHFQLYSYGIFVALGYFVGTVWILKESAQSQIKPESMFDMLVIQLVAGVLGSRLLFLIEYAPHKIFSSDFFAFKEGGLTFYGAVISSFVFDFIFLKIKKIPFWKAMDAVGLGIPLGIFIARIGCFLNGCCYGTPTSMPWGVCFSQISPDFRHPTQIYESLSGLVIFFILQRFKKHRKWHGESFLWCMSLYAFIRFFIEFLREENPILMFGLKTSQIIALAIILLSVIALKQIKQKQINY